MAPPCGWGILWGATATATIEQCFLHCTRVWLEEHKTLAKGLRRLLHTKRVRRELPTLWGGFHFWGIPCMESSAVCAVLLLLEGWRTLPPYAEGGGPPASPSSALDSTQEHRGERGVLSPRGGLGLVSPGPRLAPGGTRGTPWALWAPLFLALGSFRVGSDLLASLWALGRVASSFT